MEKILQLLILAKLAEQESQSFTNFIIAFLNFDQTFPKFVNKKSLLKITLKMPYFPL